MPEAEGGAFRVLPQTEIPFRYAFGRFGFLALASIKSASHLMRRDSSVKPAAIAAVMPRDLCTLMKF